MFKIAVAGAAMLEAYAYSIYRQEQDITTDESILRANLTQLLMPQVNKNPYITIVF